MENQVKHQRFQISVLPPPIVEKVKVLKSVPYDTSVGSIRFSGCIDSSIFLGRLPSSRSRCIAAIFVELLGTAGLSFC